MAKVLKLGANVRTVGSSAPKVRTASLHMSHETRQALIYQDPRWRRLRSLVKALWPVCVGCSRKARLLDHIIPAQLAMHLAFDIRNCQPLCYQCHSTKTEHIDAPHRSPSAYRHDKSAEADMRPQQMKEWADAMHSTGEALRRVGEPSASNRSKSKVYTGDCSC